jgi:hypothetical protein
MTQTLCVTHLALVCTVMIQLQEIEGAYSSFILVMLLQDSGKVPFSLL